MKILDLTHTITENMTVYPGTDQPSLKIICNHETDGFKETSLTMASHTGTNTWIHITTSSKTVLH